MLAGAGRSDMSGFRNRVVPGNGKGLPIFNMLKNPQLIRAEIRHTRSVASAESGAVQAEQAIS